MTVENGVRGFIGKNKGKLCSMALVLSAILFSLGFSHDAFWLSSWICLIPLMTKIFYANKTLKRVFRSLFCFFFVFYVCAYSWLISLYPLDFAGLGNVQSVLVIITGLTLIPLIHSAEMSFSVWLFNKLTMNVKSGVVKCACISLGYVFGEYLQGVGPLGFPWARIYISQSGQLWNLQSAGLFGSYFITFLVVFVNSLLAYSIIYRSKAKIYACVAAGLFLVNYIYGGVAVAVTERGYSKDNAVCGIALQGNVSSYDKWSSVENSYDKYLSLAKEASDYCKENNISPDIAVIPETAFPVTALYFQEDKGLKKTDACSVSRKMSRELDCPVLSGVFVNDNGNEYNSIVGFDKDGKILGMYHKQKLVPFGEFVPYRKLITTFLPFLSDINILSSDLCAGEIYDPVRMGSIDAAPLVCFDSVFSNGARRLVKNGGDVIAVSTNDSWYKTSKALDQHASHAVMRAIENSRPVVRSANTGISMLIEPTGKIVSRTNVNETSFLVGNIHKRKQLTLYTRVGDLTLKACFAVLALGIVVKAYKKIRRWQV